VGGIYLRKLDRYGELPTARDFLGCHDEAVNLMMTAKVVKFGMKKRVR
jgi:hypothetical protein